MNLRQFGKADLKLMINQSRISFISVSVLSIILDGE